jgi:hypothetical protein
MVAWVCDGCTIHGRSGDLVDANCVGFAVGPLRGARPRRPTLAGPSELSDRVWGPGPSPASWAPPTSLLLRFEEHPAEHDAPIYE